MLEKIVKNLPNTIVKKLRRSYLISSDLLGLYKAYIFLDRFELKLRMSKV